MFIQHCHELQNWFWVPVHDDSIIQEKSLFKLTIDMILDQQGRKIAGEMHRWFNLVRMGRALERIKAYLATGQNIQPHHLLQPIPQKQIDRLSVSGAQNLNY